MKRLISVFMAVTVLALSVPCFADPVGKFQGGVRDVMMSPLQVSDNVNVNVNTTQYTFWYHIY